jgi:alpha-tubulin suppressor-like RCC1 family protein
MAGVARLLVRLGGRDGVVVAIVAVIALVLGGAGALLVSRGGGTTTRHVPDVAPILVDRPTNVVQISAGGNHACALRATGTVACWGGTDYGRIRSLDDPHRPTPVPVPGVTRAIAIGASYTNVCIVRSDGRVLCWGDALGSGRGSLVSERWTVPPGLVPGIRDATSIPVGNARACAVRVTGEVACWGAGGSGQLGDSEPTPVAVGRLRDARGIASGQAFQCASRAHGTVVSFGADILGQLGTGTALGNYGPDVRIPWDPVHFPVAGT